MFSLFLSLALQLSIDFPVLLVAATKIKIFFLLCSLIYIKPDVHSHLNCKNPWGTGRSAIPYHTIPYQTMCRCGGCAGVPHEGRGGVPRAGAWLGAGHWGQHGPGRQHRDRVAEDHGQYSITITFILLGKLLNTTTFLQCTILTKSCHGLWPTGLF